MSFQYKVLITTSGIGSRLGDFTKFTNKSLLRIGDKPAISYIIEAYPKETKFVITLGYFGDQVKDFLEIAYPEISFEFVWVEKFQGEGSSLLFSMSHAKSVLQCPFVFHASDTIINGAIPFPTYNWNGGFKGVGSNNYASFDVLGESIKVIYDKGNSNPDFLHIGLAGIYDYEKFWKLVDETLIEKNFSFTLGDVDILRKMILTNDFRVFDVRTWYDIGNIDKMNEAKAILGKGGIHVLDKLGESIFKINGNIIKFFYDEKICQNRVIRNSSLQGIAPRILAHSKNFYKYPYVQGNLYANIANRSNFESLLNWASANLWKKVETIDAIKMQKLCLDFYFTKTKKRLEDLYETRGISDTVEVINQEEVPTVLSMIERIDKEELCSTVPVLFHGDFILDNIIHVEKNNFQLIDWRQDFAGELTAGDMYYDLGKLAHNLVVNHEIIDNNQFEVKKLNDGSILINIHRLQSLVDCERIFFEWVKDTGLNLRKIHILRAIIWLNMSPLHHHPFDLFLYYFGKYNLHHALKAND